MSDTIGSVLEYLLPNHQDQKKLIGRAQEINSYHASGEISDQEREDLLADLVRTQVIAREANEQEQRILMGQVVKVLSMIPIP
jgi:transcription elongation GreA/GreB family factor